MAFATVYAALISINYYVQLAWVMPRLAAGRTAGMEAFLFVPFDSFLYAVDILGYSFMSVATLCMALVFTGRGIERLARRFLDRQRAAAAVHRPADVLALAHLDRGAVGDHVPGRDVVARPRVQSSADDAAGDGDAMK